jgi:hypothetical protein
MSDQSQSAPVISLELATAEFSRAYSSIITRLIIEKLEIIELNSRLTAHVADQQKIIKQLENEVSLIKSQPDP